MARLRHLLRAPGAGGAWRSAAPLAPPCCQRRFLSAPSSADYEQTERSMPGTPETSASGARVCLWVCGSCCGGAGRARPLVAGRWSLELGQRDGDEAKDRWCSLATDRTAPSINRVKIDHRLSFKRGREAAYQSGRATVSASTVSMSRQVEGRLTSRLF